MADNISFAAQVQRHVDRIRECAASYGQPMGSQVPQLYRDPRNPDLPPTYRYSFFNARTGTRYIYVSVQAHEMYSHGLSFQGALYPLVAPPLMNFYQQQQLLQWQQNYYQQPAAGGIIPGPAAAPVPAQWVLGRCPFDGNEPLSVLETRTMEWTEHGAANGENARALLECEEEESKLPMQLSSDDNPARSKFDSHASHTPSSPPPRACRAEKHWP